MANKGELVRFVGSYFIETGIDLRHIMTSIPRDGIVLENNLKFIKILSDNEVCILIPDQKKMFKIKVLTKKEASDG